MKRLTLAVVVIVGTLLVSLGAITVMGQRSADAIPGATAVVTVKDIDFFATGNNPVGVAADDSSNVKVGILGLPIFGPRESTPILTLTADGVASEFTSLPLATDLGPCETARPGRDFISPGVQQEPTPFMTGLVYHQSGDLYAGLPNCISSTHGIWRVHPDGSAEPFAVVDLSQLPKGLAFTNGEFPLYVTDLHDFTHSRADCKAVAGTPNACVLRIWRIDQNGNVTVWKESTLFYGDPDSPLLHPHGVNGIVVDDAGRNVYVTVTDHGRVIRIPINRGGSAGAAQVIFEDKNYWGMDGITIGPDGNLYIVIVRTDQLVALHPDGSSFRVLVQGHPLDGPTQLTFGEGRAARGKKALPPLYITNGSGARIFFYNVAFVLGQGSLLDGITQLVNLGAKTAEEVVDLQPHPSVVRVLLSTECRPEQGRILSESTAPATGNAAAIRRCVDQVPLR
jgi:sugar lactone lactonase YvrE